MNEQAEAQRFSAILDGEIRRLGTLDQAAAGDELRELVELAEKVGSIRFRRPAGYDSATGAPDLSREGWASRRRPKLAGRLRRLAFAALALVLALIAGGVLLVSPGFAPGTVASASAIIDGATTKFGAAQDPHLVVYERYEIEWTVGEHPNTATGELWTSSEGERSEFRLTGSDGTLFYFSRRDHDRVLLPVLDRPIGGGPVRELHEVTLEQAIRSGEGIVSSGGSAALQVFLESDLASSWQAIATLLRYQARLCTSQECLLGIISDDRKCDAERCTYFANGQPTAEASVQSQVDSETGRSVYQIQIRRLPRPDWKWDIVRELTVDAETLQLLKVAMADNTSDASYFTVTWQETQLVQASALPTDLLSTLPEGVSLTEPDLDATPSEAPDSAIELAGPRQDGSAGSDEDEDRVWLEEVSPPSELSFECDEVRLVEFDFVVGYDLVSVNQAYLEVNLARPGWDAPANFGETLTRLPIIGGAQIRIDAQRHRVRATFQLDLEEEYWIGEGRVSPMLWIGVPAGIVEWKSIVDHVTFDEYWWDIVPGRACAGE